MNGELAQAIALALHGSAWLADPTGPVPDLEAGPTFQYVRHLRFTAASATSGPPLVWASATEWLTALHEAGTERILIVAPREEPRVVAGEPVEDHMLAGFAGAGRWAMVSTGPEGAVAWPAQWEVGDQQAPDHRIWDVTYHGGLVDGAEVPAAASVEVATAELTSSLTEVEAFARSNGVDGWADCFRDALAVFAADDPQPPYYHDLLPPDLGIDRRRLASAAAASWVFGGMGSWNDLGFERPEPQGTYDRISARLFRAVLDALVAAVNG